MIHTADLTALWWAGVRAVQGKQAVIKAIDAFHLQRPDQVLAVGKAAVSMAAAACEKFSDVPTTIVTKYHHIEGAPAHAQLIEAAHPVPDAASLAAGSALQSAVAACPKGAHLLMLVSGGASALAEVLPGGMSLDDLAQTTQAMLASGADIHAMNAQRKDISLIKGGKLLSGFGGKHITTLAISDVQGDALGVIGSGIGDAPHKHSFGFDAHIVANNQIARDAVAQSAALNVQTNTETLYEDVSALAPQIAQHLINGDKGLHIMGANPRWCCPPTPARVGATWRWRCSWLGKSQDGMICAFSWQVQTEQMARPMPPVR